MNIYSDCDSKSFFLNDFMDILKNLNDLWHYDDFLNDFLQNIRNFN